METATFLTLLVAMLFLITSRRVVAYVPEGYILNVLPECGEDEQAPARITVVTDLPYPRGSAKCLDGHNYEFFGIDDATFQLPVTYIPAPEQCAFFRHNTSGLYVVPVVIQWGSPHGQIQHDEERFLVTCTFNGRANSGSDFKEIVEAEIAPQEIQTNVGPNTTSKFSLHMTDILGDDLLQPVHIGRMVKLVATSDGDDVQGGMKAVSCDAVSANQRFAILRAGCGDGLVFPKTSGFITNGNVSTSPIFSAFRLFRKYSVYFDCNFTLCRNDCDGSSCTSAPTKRSANGDNPGAMISLSSEPVSFATEGQGENTEVTFHNRRPHQNPWEVLVLSVSVVVMFVMIVSLGRALLQMYRPPAKETMIYTIM